MTDTPVTLEVSRTRHHPLSITQEPGLGPVRFPDLSPEQVRMLCELVDDGSPCYEVREVQAVAPPSASGRHRRTLGSGAPASAPAPDLTPSFADTHPRAAKELGDLIADLTQPEAEAPATVRFDVDLVYSCYQSEGIWTEAKTSQDTLFAEDQEKALVIAEERLLRKLRRAGSVSRTDHLKIISGTTRVSADA